MHSYRRKPTETMLTGLMIDDFQPPLTLVDRAQRLNPIRPIVSCRPEGSLDGTLIGEMWEAAPATGRGTSHPRDRGDGEQDRSARCGHSVRRTAREGEDGGAVPSADRSMGNLGATREMMPKH